MRREVEQLQEKLLHSLKLYDVQVSLALGELMVRVPLTNLENVIQFLREDTDCWFRQLMDICGVDYPARAPRFDIVYHLLSLTHNLRIRIVVGVEEGDLIPSLVPFFRSAGWFEREVYDMYGLFFKHHTDLRRILTDYTFEGHPLRKDFPLVGNTEVFYSTEQERVMERPVYLEQPLREYHYGSMWQGSSQPFRASTFEKPDREES